MMLGKRDKIGLLALLGIAAYVYSQQSQASPAPAPSSSDTGGSAAGFSSFPVYTPPSPGPASAPATNSGTSTSWLSDLFSTGSGTNFDTFGSNPAPAPTPTPAPAPAPTPAPAPSTSLSFTGWISSLFSSSAPAYTSTGQLNMTAPWKTNAYPQYALAIANAEAKYGIPHDLLARQLYEESRYRPDIINGTTRSATGAVGIAQFEPATAAQYGIDPTNPQESIIAAAKYMAALYKEFGTWQLALMAYNWGPGNVSHYVSSGDTLPVPSETQTYVAQITADVPVA